MTKMRNPGDLPYGWSQRVSGALAAYGPPKSTHVLSRRPAGSWGDKLALTVDVAAFDLPPHSREAIASASETIRPIRYSPANRDK